MRGFAEAARALVVREVKNVGSVTMEHGHPCRGVCDVSCVDLISQRCPCVLGNSLGSREFSVPRNGVCIIKRSGIMGMKLVSIKVSVRPKLGQFGTASIEELAYRAGGKAGDDYFEYISVQSFNGRPPREYRTRNVVHVTP